MAVVAEERLEWNGLSTWYRVAGEARAGRRPVIVCHGGPGATHDEVEAIAKACRSSGRRCVLYDQVGNGRSTHRPDAGSGFWTIALFLEELRRLVLHLGWREGYHLIGHSWGGMLGLEHALTDPPGLASLTLCGTPHSLDAFGREAKRMRAEVDAATMEEAMAAVFARHVCRRLPPPDAVTRTAAWRSRNPEVFAAMNGPDPFETTGALKGWTVVDRLRAIAVPTLLASGRHDLVGPAQVEAMRDGLPHARCELFEKSSHMPFIEEPARFRRVVATFLDEVDGVDAEARR